MKRLRFLKRIIAMLLVLVMGTSGALQTVSVYAAETVSTQVDGANDSGDSQDGDAAVDSNISGGSTSEDGVSLDDNMTVTGTNGFGNLLADALSTEAEEQAQNNGYNVFSIEMSGNTATVDMEALGDCTLIVALYDNDGKVMLTSNATEVTKDTREATVQLEATKIPQYYYLRAFLVDTITYQPMCTMYESNLYTEAMQAFLAKTTDDFDQDKVLNLDDDKNNNFAVFSDTTKLIPTVEGVNKITSVDDATGTYTFDNVDSNITSLVAGDIFAYEYNGELYIVKVASVSVSGTTATIVEGETSMEDVFEYVKVDTVSGVEDAIIDDSTCSEGVTYVGLVDADEVEIVEVGATQNQIDDGLHYIESDKTNDVYAFEADVSKSKELVYTIDIDEDEKELGGGVQAEFSVKGSISASLTGNIKYYLSLDTQYIEISIEYSFGFSVTLEGKLNKEIELSQITLLSAYGVNLVLIPKFKLEGAVTVSIVGTLSGTAGISVSVQKGVQPLNTTPKFKTGVEVEGHVFIGLTLSPQINIVCEKIAKAEIEFTAGVDITASTFLGLDTDAGKHRCTTCIGGDVSVKFELTYSIGLAKMEYNNKIFSLKIKICDFYYSVDYKTFGFGTCPFSGNRVDVYVLDDGKPLSRIELQLKDYTLNIFIEKTDSNGKATFLLPDNSYIITGYNSEDEDILGENISVSTDMTVTIDITRGTGIEDFIWDDNDGEGSGVEDEEEDEQEEHKPTSIFEYVVLDDGTLEVKAWRGDATEIVIPSNVNGRIVTSIGREAFCECDGIQYVYIPGSVKDIGQYAFSRCHSLQNVVMSEGVINIGWAAFRECTNLVNVNIPKSVRNIESNAFCECVELKSVNIPNGVTTISGYLFSGCVNLEQVNIPNKVECINMYAFENCDSLTNVDIPESVTYIGAGAFYDCDGLAEIDIPGNVEIVDYQAFRDCSNLKSVNMSEGVETIYKWAFIYCSNLVSVNIPKSVISIGYGAFEGCANLKSVSVPGNVSTIDDWAFAHCTNLSIIDISNGVKIIGTGAFINCAGLTSVNLPESVVNIRSHAFQGCINLEIANIPKNVTHIGVSAFKECTSLASIVIDNPTVSISEEVFLGCISLKSIEIPASVTSIDSTAFTNCINLTKIVAYCDPSVLEGALEFEGKNSALEVVYATPEPTTLSELAETTQSDVTSVVKTESVSNTVLSSNETTQPSADLTPIPATQASQVKSIDLTSNSVTYTDLVPGQMYNFYIFKSEKADNIFADGNLVYIEQVTADENGSVIIAYTLDDIYCDVVLKLVSDGKVNIADTNISEVTGWKYEGYEMPPYIGITYNGKALVQGRDYHLSGDVVADGMGIYDIKVTGDGAFTGEKSFRYIVTGDCVFGDGNGDNVVDIKDAVQLKQRIAGMDVNMNTYAADVNADTEIDIKDAVKLMKYIAGYRDIVLGEAS